VERPEADAVSQIALCGICAYQDAVPHLTVGDRPARGSRGPAGSRGRTAARPAITARISRVWLMTGTTAPGSWRTMAELPLAIA
jgi:hypothetical protein